MLIRPACVDDKAAILAIIEPVIQAGETYAQPRGMTKEQLWSYWANPEHEVFVLQDEGKVLGSYYLRANQKGGGAHVANCGYVTAGHAYGRGIARRMGLHSIERAKIRGFKAMQFNCVVSTNVRAVKLWQSLGFAIAGSLAGAFLHPAEGYVDAFVMYRSLE